MKKRVICLIVMAVLSLCSYPSYAGRASAVMRLGRLGIVVARSKFRKTCPVCNGEKHIPVYFGLSRKNCENCSGTGKVLDFNKVAGGGGVALIIIIVSCCYASCRYAISGRKEKQ